MLSGRKNQPAVKPRRSAFRIEGLESRQLLSAATDIVFQPASLMGRADTGTTVSPTLNTTVQGYTPAQIRQAYGFDKISFGTGGAADGAGQTIAIVDAYNDPNLVADLKVFDKQFGLPDPPSLQIVSQTGSAAKLPKTDAGWASEIALDVEWAHAMAPGANILLVEANSASLTDLMAAVDYARKAPGVSTVSMSWGGSEFFSWNTQGEFAGQTQYDPYFTTPAGHQGVTFVAAAGDSGSSSGVLWPASSPNVLSVGGTTLNLSSTGSYGSESTWSGTTGGYSIVENEPAYQANVQNSGARSVPDVSFDADPNTGFAVYDSLAYSGYSGWQEVGGTSAGSPQWAALIAIANQGRAAAGSGSLDGVKQTLPLLYGLYVTNAAAGNATAAASTTPTYATSFNDVIDPTSTGRYHWRWGWGFSGNQSTAGYDTATGLGTPRAAIIVNALVGNSTGSTGSSSNGSNGSGSNGSTTPTPAQLPAAPLGAVFVSSLPSTAIDGEDESVRIRISNTSGKKFSGPVKIDLYASLAGTATASDTLLNTLTIPKMTLGAGASKTVKVNFAYPDPASGNYYITAAVTATGTNTAQATAVSSARVAVSRAVVDLATTFASQPIVNAAGKGWADVTITNKGNVTTSGTLDSLKLYGSTDAFLDSADVVLATLSTRRIKLDAGRSITFKVHFAAPTGVNNLIATASTSTSPPDDNAANNTAVTTIR